ncbi:glycosyltransferase [Halorussus sp. MSC15.2]|uniref:glycosyltransferase n=1 Tax=Halorussus sp. MSC15.2 TaxID=2283638 RepID=UPI0013D71D0C|nr:glycosyltransferase [Halorussus sp. MSC15.2]NEU56570.1 glycosyltransferase [Halorussus sp. MSC15.2]
MDTRGFAERGDRPWSEREPGFVTIGRLARYKNVLDNVEIIDRVRERGHDVHLHLVGPGYDDEYAREVKRAASERDYVSVEGECSREELVEIVCRHRYGLHGKRHEHFGMAVAELVAGGTVPFVPDNGGQREIVGSDRLTYDTVPEAVERIDRVLSNPDTANDLRRDAAEIEREYGRDRFQREIRAVVADALA